jgi:hypothetical protein
VASVKPKSVEDNKKGGWKTSGNSGGGLSGRDGAYVKKPPGRVVTYEKGQLPQKKSLGDLP